MYISISISLWRTRGRAAQITMVRLAFSELAFWLAGYWWLIRTFICIIISTMQDSTLATHKHTFVQVTKYNRRQSTVGKGIESLLSIRSTLYRTVLSALHRPASLHIIIYFINVYHQHINKAHVKEEPKSKIKPDEQRPLWWNRALPRLSTDWLKLVPGWCHML